MRVGANPIKNSNKVITDFNHQIVIPVYIPNSEGYFKESFQILKYCLKSLFKTCHDKTFITIIDNGSHKEVKDYLEGLYDSLKIHEVIHTSNIGKVNAILKGITGHNFHLITISDADVLFLSNWQNKTIEVFNSFPKAGVVSPTPSSKSYSNLTANLIHSLFFSKKLAFTPVLNPKALKMFAKSIGNAEFYNKYHLSQYLTVTSGEIKAVVGAGHFCATYRKEVFDSLPSKYSQFKLGGKSMSKFIDERVINRGLWRLSTNDNFACHMGNIEEDWMLETLSQIHPSFLNSELKLYSPVSLSKLYFSKNRIITKLLNITVFRRYFFKQKGLALEALDSY